MWRAQGDFKALGLVAWKAADVQSQNWNLNEFFSAAVGCSFATLYTIIYIYIYIHKPQNKLQDLYFKKPEANQAHIASKIKYMGIPSHVDQSFSCGRRSSRG